MYGSVRLCSAAILATVAFAEDLYCQKVPNAWIFAGWLWGLGIQGAAGGLCGIARFLAGAGTPIFWLFPLFYFRMLGPGDIKLLSALGGFLGFHAVARLMVLSFFLGGILSLGILTIHGMLWSRLRYFANYFRMYIQDRKRRAYYKPGDRAENLHFTLPILLGVFLYVGGVY